MPGATRPRRPAALRHRLSALRHRLTWPPERPDRTCGPCFHWHCRDGRWGECALLGTWTHEDSGCRGWTPKVYYVTADAQVLAALEPAAARDIEPEPECLAARGLDLVAVLGIVAGAIAGLGAAAIVQAVS